MLKLEFDIPDYLSSMGGGIASVLGTDVRERIILSLANAHAEAVKDEAKANAPIKSGRLRDSIRAKFLNERLGVLEATAPHAKFLHFGTGIYGRKNEAITIKPKQKKALHWPGAKHPVKRVRQRGIKPNDFLRMAMEQKRIEDRMRPVVQSLIREAVMESIIRAAANSSAGASTSRAREAENQETNGFTNMPSSFSNTPADFTYPVGSTPFWMGPDEIIQQVKWAEAAAQKKTCSSGRKGSTYGERFVKNWKIMHYPIIQSPIKATIATFVSGGQLAKMTNTMTPLQWARTGFRPLVIGGASFTLLESAVIVGGEVVLNAAVVLVGYEIGVTIGSAISAGIQDPCYW